MTKDDIIKLLEDSLKLVKANEFSYHVTRRLWMEANCLLLSIIDAVMKHKPKDNGTTN